MIDHIVTEPCFTVGLLFRSHLTVARLFHQRNLFLLGSNEHQHTGSEITAGKRVLSEECQGLQVGHIAVEQHVRDTSVGQFLREACGLLKGRGYDNHTIELLREELPHHTGKRRIVETFVIDELQRDTEVATEISTGLRSFLNLVPVGLLLMLRQYAIEGVLLIIGKGRGVHVWLVVHLCQRLVHLLKSRLGNIRTIVEYTVDCTYRNTCAFGDILDSDILFSHFNKCFCRAKVQIIIDSTK